MPAEEGVDVHHAFVLGIAGNGLAVRIQLSIQAYPVSKLPYLVATIDERNLDRDNYSQKDEYDVSNNSQVP